MLHGCSGDVSDALTLCAHASQRLQIPLSTFYFDLLHDPEEDTAGIWVRNALVETHAVFVRPWGLTEY